MQQYIDPELMNKKPKHYTVVDNIYQTEIKETLAQLHEDSIRKLKQLNTTIEERIQKGTDVIYQGTLDPVQQEEEKQALFNAHKRVQNITQRVHS